MSGGQERPPRDMKQMGASNSEVSHSSLLATKIAPPSAAPRGAISRDRLTALVAEVESHVLTVAKAPTGFGKTTLALAWVKEFARKGVRVGWFSVDPEDDDEKRFFYYLHRAALMADDKPGVQQGQVHGDMRAEDLRTTTLHHAADLDDALVPGVDNYHCITQARVHAHIASLLHQAPS